MGSSLKVSPVADVKDKIPHHVPQILINMEALPHMTGFDVQLLGYCDTVVSELCKLLEWELTSVSQVDKKDEPAYRQGTLPHRFIFEGGTETPFATLSDDSDVEAEDEDDSDTGSDITSDEEDIIIDASDAQPEEVIEPATVISTLDAQNLDHSKVKSENETNNII